MTMRAALFLTLVMLSFSCQRRDQPAPAAAPPDQGRHDAGDLALLVGKWKVVRAVADGKSYSYSYRQAKFEIAAGGKYTFAIPGLIEENGTITVRPDKNPKEMDLTPDGQAMNRLQPSIDMLQDALGHAPQSKGPRKIQVQLAIYKLDGDDLTICSSMIENRRPTELETSADSWRVLLTCKRKTIADEQKPEIATAPTPPPLPQELQQAWVKGGAEVGWMGMLSEPVTLDFQTSPKGLIDPVPAFRLKVLNDGTLAKLPAPKAPFGLYLLDTDATDADLKELATLESLHTLDLAFTKLTDAGLKNLSSLKSLSVLKLFATGVTDAGLKELASMKSLHSLDLRVLHVTDVGLKELAGLKNLKFLNLVGTKITDAGLKELAGLSSLQHLDVTDTQVTDDGVKKLKKALPDCQILN